MPNEYVTLLNLGSSYGGKREWRDDLVYCVSDGKYYYEEWEETDNGRTICSSSTDYKPVDESKASKGVLDAITKHRATLKK